jgi:hypothetical protein
VQCHSLIIEQIQSRQGGEEVTGFSYIDWGKVMDLMAMGTRNCMWMMKILFYPTKIHFEPIY